MQIRTDANADLKEDGAATLGLRRSFEQLQNATLNKARALGMRTARLPLAEHLSKMASTPVLTCTHVVQLVLALSANGGNWARAIEHVLPARKGAKVVDSGEAGVSAVGEAAAGPQPVQHAGVGSKATSLDSGADAKTHAKTSNYNNK